MTDILTAVKKKTANPFANDIAGWLSWWSRTEYAEIAINVMDACPTNTRDIILALDACEKRALFEEFCRTSKGTEILDTVKNEKDFDNKLKAAALSEEDKARMLEVLEGNIYKNTEKYKEPKALYYVVARIDAIYGFAKSAKSAKYEGWGYEDYFDGDENRFTVEHVLPQSHGGWSEWNEIDGEHWLHRIGNLTLLSSAYNSSVSNKDFAAKLEEYAKEAKGKAWNTALLTDVRTQKEWTPKTVEARQGRILATVKDWLYKPAWFYDLGKE